MTASNSRPTIEELKSDWCESDLTIYASFAETEVYAMPRAESTKSRKYMELLLNVATYSDAQALFEEYSADPKAPRLTPILFDLKADIELLDQRVQQDYLSRKVWNPERWESTYEDMLKYMGFADLRPEYECSISSLWEEVRELPFLLAEDPCYNADEIPRYVSQAQLWTDFWIPEEIALEIGVPDNHMGMDYVPAEYNYLDLNAFVESFKKCGVEVLVDDKMIDFLVWEWTHLQYPISAKNLQS